MILKFRKLQKQTLSQRRSARTSSCSRRSSGRCRLLYYWKVHQRARTPGRTRSSPTRDCRTLYDYKVPRDEHHSDPTPRPTTPFPSDIFYIHTHSLHNPPYNCTFYQRRIFRPQSISWVPGSDSTPAPLSDTGHRSGSTCPDTRVYYSPSAAYLRAMRSSYWAANAHSPRNCRSRRGRQNSKTRCSTCIVHFYYYIFLY